MNETLDVAVNPDGPQTLVPEQEAIETGGSITVTFHNKGTPTHVHVGLEGPLANVARVDAPNHFLEGGRTRSVTIHVPEGPRPIDGKIKLVTGHGQVTSYVSVRVIEADDTEDVVEVDETLSEPPVTTEPERTVPIARAVPVVLLAAGATALAVGSVLYLDRPAVRLAAVVVIVGVLAAILLALD